MNFALIGCAERTFIIARVSRKSITDTRPGDKPPPSDRSSERDPIFNALR